MGLFGKKGEENELPPIRFPELPKSVPSFDSDRGFSEAEEIKSAVSSQSSMLMPGMSMGSEQPLFVKIEKYRDVVFTLNDLKSRLNDADNTLSKLQKLKAEEDRELSAWQRDLEKIRNQLLDIDHNLFENA